MKFSAQLDVNIVAHEADDEVALLLDLEAPGAPESAVERASTSLQVVLDRSGSMSGDPLAGAVKALVGLVQRLDSRDNFGVVVFDDQAEVVVPAGPLTDKAEVVQRLQSIQTGGTTDLGVGYLRGMQEIRRVCGQTGGTLLVISDGHINSGITDMEQFGEIAAKAYAEGVVTSTLGYGLGYDETLLSVIARAGSGNHQFAHNADAAGAAIASEVAGLLTKSIQAASLTVQFESSVEMLRLYNDLPAMQIGPGKVMIELGDFYFGEQRKLLMRFHVPAMAALGLAQIASLELRYVELPGLIEHLVTMPVAVNVVPGDEAAGRIPDPVVHTEVLFQEAQQSKRLASEALERGDRAAAKQLLDSAVEMLRDAGDAAPDSIRGEVLLEAADVEAMGARVLFEDAAFTSKLTRASYHQQNRKRGRRSPRDSDRS